MHIDKSFVLEHLREEGQRDKVQHALDQLPKEIDHEKRSCSRRSVSIPASLRRRP
jgi:hypothetical protein